MSEETALTSLIILIFAMINAAIVGNAVHRRSYAVAAFVFTLSVLCALARIADKLEVLLTK